MDFSDALRHLKNGYRITREGWNGKDMFLYLVPGSQFEVNRPPLLGIYPEGTVVDYAPHIDMKTAQGYCVPWLASQSDLMAGDWETVSFPATNTEAMVHESEDPPHGHHEDDADPNAGLEDR